VWVQELDQEAMQADAKFAEVEGLIGKAVLAAGAAAAAKEQVAHAAVERKAAEAAEAVEGLRVWEEENVVVNGVPDNWFRGKAGSDGLPCLPQPSLASRVFSGPSDPRSAQSTLSSQLRLLPRPLATAPAGGRGAKGTESVQRPLLDLVGMRAFSAIYGEEGDPFVFPKVLELLKFGDKHPAAEEELEEELEDWRTGVPWAGPADWQRPNTAPAVVAKIAAQVCAALQ
jgi:hypothetical protein